MFENVPDGVKSSILSVLVFVFFFFMLSFVKKKLIKKSLNIHEQSKEYRETSGIIFSILQYLIIVLAIVIILKINGYNVTSIVAGLGIFATLVGLALQDTLKDIISGIHIYMDNYYKVGDVVEYDGKMCEVKYFSTNVTKFLVLADDSTITVANRNISKINKLKGTQTVTFQFSYSADEKQIKEMFESACAQLRENEMYTSVEYLGLISLERFGPVYGVCITSKPLDAPAAKLNATQTIYKKIKEADIRLSAANF